MPLSPQLDQQARAWLDADPDPGSDAENDA